MQASKQAQPWQAVVNLEMRKWHQAVAEAARLARHSLSPTWNRHEVLLFDRIVAAGVCCFGPCREAAARRRLQLLRQNDLTAYLQAGRAPSVHVIAFSFNVNGKPRDADAR